MDIQIRDIPGFPGYKVSSDGRVFSCNYNKTGITKELKVDISNCGYKRVEIYQNRKPKKMQVSRLVALAFVPNPFNLPQINHIDANKQHDDWTNLEWCNQQENTLHARDNGLLPFCKINMAIANKIRELYATGTHTQDSLGEIYGMSGHNIGMIVNNKLWRAE